MYGFVFVLCLGWYEAGFLEFVAFVVLDWFVLGFGNLVAWF